MAYPSVTTQRSVPGSASPSYITTTLSSSYVETTFIVASASTWYEVGTNGKVTTNPLGTSGVFDVVVDFGLSTEEHILCSAVNPSTGVVTIWTDGTLNGRGWDGTPISAHSVGAASNLNCFPFVGGTDFAAITKVISTLFPNGGTSQAYNFYAVSPTSNPTLTGQFNKVNTSASGQSVTLPPIVANGQFIYIGNNNSTYSLTVYPNLSSQSIDGYTAGTPIYIAPNAYWLGFVESTGSAGNWVSVIPSMVGQGPLTVSYGDGTLTFALGGLTNYGSAGQAVVVNSGANGYTYQNITAFVEQSTAPVSTTVLWADTSSTSTPYVPLVYTLTGNAAQPIPTTMVWANYDLIEIKGQTNAITSMSTGITTGLNDGKIARIAIYNTSGIPLTISWGSQFQSSSILLPTQFANGRTDYAFTWTSDSVWRLIGVV